MATRAIGPLRRAELPYALRLIGRQDHVSDAMLRHQFQRLDVNSRFRQPHTFRIAAKTRFEIGDAPEDFRFLVAAVRQRQNRMMERLGDRIAVAAEALAALPIGAENGVVDFQIVTFEPAHQSRANVEADHRIVVDDAHDAVLRVENARHRVGAVALGGDPFVPIVERVSGVL